jgi:antitoxin YefM
MRSVSEDELGEQFDALLDHAVADHAPVLIRRPDGEDVVLISASGWAGMKETLHLMSSPKNAERLLEAVREFEAGDDGVALP